MEDPADVFVVSSRPYGQRAVLKFARYIGSTAIAGRYTPGMVFNTLMSKSSLFGFVDTYEWNLLTPRSCDFNPIIAESAKKFLKWGED